MSPKQSSLAFVEEVQSSDQIDDGFEPVLNVLDKSRHNVSRGISAKIMTEEVVMVRGRVTVSF